MIAGVAGRSPDPIWHAGVRGWPPVALACVLASTMTENLTISATPAISDTVAFSDWSPLLSEQMALPGSQTNPNLVSGAGSHRNDHSRMGAGFRCVCCVRTGRDTNQNGGEGC